MKCPKCGSNDIIEIGRSPVEKLRDYGTYDVDVWSEKQEYETLYGCNNCEHEFTKSKVENDSKVVEYDDDKTNEWRKCRYICSGEKCEELGVVEGEISTCAISFKVMDHTMVIPTPDEFITECPMGKGKVTFKEEWE